MSEGLINFPSIDKVYYELEDQYINIIRNINMSSFEDGDIDYRDHCVKSKVFNLKREFIINGRKIDKVNIGLYWSSDSIPAAAFKALEIDYKFGGYYHCCVSIEEECICDSINLIECFIHERSPNEGDTYIDSFFLEFLDYIKTI